MKKRAEQLKLSWKEIGLLVEGLSLSSRPMIRGAIAVRRAHPGQTGGF